MKRKTILAAIVVITFITAAGILGYWWGWWQSMLSGAPPTLSSQAAVGRFGHEWNSMLGAYSHQGVVDYSAWRERRDDLGKLLDSLRTVSPQELDRDNALGFWIDYYNARTVYEVLGGQSPATNVGRTTLFFLTRFQVAGRMWSLDTLEKMIRSTFHDPRVHFALNCASKSCPALRGESYTAASARLSTILSDQGKMFLYDSNKNRFDTVHRKANISQIFEWYRADFEANGRSLQSFLAPYLDPATADLLRNDRFEIEYIPYDWSLNGTR